MNKGSLQFAGVTSVCKLTLKKVVSSYACPVAHACMLQDPNLAISTMLPD